MIMGTTDNMSEEEEKSATKSSLILKNITVLTKRTSIRLEPEMWKALKQISQREKCSIHDLCSLISIRKNPESSLTAAIRVFLMLYFRSATTEAGHENAGHGSFENMKRRAGMASDWSAIRYQKAREQDSKVERVATPVRQSQSESRIEVR